MTIKSYFYIVLLVTYGVVHLIRVYDKIYKGTAYIDMPGLYLFERFFIPFFVFIFILGQFIIPNNTISVLDWFVKKNNDLLWISIILIIINFVVLHKYPVVWERNLCIALPTIIVFMMVLGYFKIW
jgi:hypothetical protein